MAVLARPCLLAIGVALAACGGGDEGGLFGKGSGGAAGASASGGTSGGSGGAPSGGSAGAGQGGTSSGGASGSAGASGGAPSDGGGATDAGASGGTGGAGGASGVGTGHCGALTCAFSAGDACCKPEGAALYCSNAALSNPCKCSGILCDALEIKCDGPEDCPSGKICCAERGLTSSTWDVVECREKCTSDPIVGSTRREVCHPGGQPCASGAACQSDAGLPSGYATCAQ
ncbi:MAG: hypothetical protein KJ015_16525 [Myxococcales bacterium]|nr:hypothetical protein [Myxococcales bacterium]